MKIDSAWKRLEEGRFWRIVDAEHNRLIASQLEGCHRVLDVGCGYGSLTAYLNNAGFDTVGVDEDVEMIQQSGWIFPSMKDEKIRLMEAGRLDFPDGEFDAIVLRDTMHHIWEEADVDQAFTEIERVLKSRGVLVVFDPNPNLILKLSRMLARHKDAQCRFEEASELLRKRGWTIRHSFYAECFSLAISGGYVGVDFATGWKPLHKVLITLDRNFSRFLNKIGLGPAILWRYCIKAERYSD